MIVPAGEGGRVAGTRKRGQPSAEVDIVAECTVAAAALDDEGLAASRWKTAISSRKRSAVEVRCALLADQLQ